MNQAVIEQDGMSRNTPANPTPDSLTGLLLPLSDRTLLLPNVAVAELIAYRNPQVAAGLPQWYLGQVAWRDLRLPLLSFEAASSGEQQPVLGSSARVVVINALGGRPHVKFLALLVQGIPRSVRLDANLASTAAPLAALELAAVDIGGETARIPDLAGLEEKLADAQPAEDLLSLDGMSKELALDLALRGVTTREDLAEQSIDDLLDIDGMDEERAGKLIMAARAHWFE